MSRRRPLFLILLLSMLLHAVSLGGHWAGAGNVQQAVHALLHWAGSAHHHHAQHADAAEALQGFEAFAEELAAATPISVPDLHQDQSGDSNMHMGIDGCLSGIGPIPSCIGGPGARSAAATQHLPLAENAPEGPFLEGLKKPPKTRA